MKKTYLGPIFIMSIILTFGGHIVGQLDTNSGESKTNTNNHYTMLDSSSYTESSLNSIRTMFCNNGLEEEKLTRGLSLIMRPGEEKEICIMHFNLGPKDIYLRGAFPENAIEANGNRNCSDRNNRDDPFAKFIKPFEEASIKVPGKGYAIRKTTIKYPIGMSGMQKGCFAYGEYRQQSDEGSGEMFFIVTRKINSVDVLVAGKGDIRSKLISKDIIIELDENKKASINFNLENKGSVDEIADVKISFSSVFGYKKTFLITGLFIGVGKTETFNTKNFGTKFELPRYKSLFNISLEIKHKPSFSFDVSSAGIDQNILEGGTILQTKNIFIFPTTPAIGLFAFIILFYLAFFKKSKIIIQQIPVSENKK